MWHSKKSAFYSIICLSICNNNVDSWRWNNRRWNNAAIQRWSNLHIRHVFDVPDGTTSTHDVDSTFKRTVFSTLFQHRFSTSEKPRRRHNVDQWPRSNCHTHRVFKVVSTSVNDVGSRYYPMLEQRRQLTSIPISYAPCFRCCFDVIADIKTTWIQLV